MGTGANFRYPYRPRPIGQRWPVASVPIRLLNTHNYGNILSRMKTTVDIPDELFVAAKKRAAELRQPLRELFERGLRAEISRPAATAGRKKPVKLTWVTVDGGLPTGVDITDRAAMHDWLSGQR